MNDLIEVKFFFFIYGFENQGCLDLLVKIEVLVHRFESPPFFVLCTGFMAQMDQINIYGCENSSLLGDYLASISS